MSEPAKPAASLYQPVAIEQVVGILSRLPDPDDVLLKLGLGRHELRKLETDDEIAAALETRRDAVVATPWRLEPYEGEAAEWLWLELEPHIEALMRGAWEAVPYGYSVIEVVYRRPSAAQRRIGIDYLGAKPMEWFGPQRDGSLLFMPPSGGSAHLVDTSAKFLLTRRNPSYRNPYGEALLSRAYWPWFFRYNGWRFWMAFLERFSEPLLVGRVYTPTEFVEAMRGLGFGAVVGVGVEEEVDAVTASGAGEFARVEAALLQRIQRLILGQTLTSQVDGKGSYAAAQVHNEVRDDKRRADIRLVSRTVQRLIDALWSLNRLPGEPPAFVLQDDQGLDAERAARDAQLVQAGVLRLTDQYLLSNYDFEEGDFTVTPSAPPLNGPAANFAALPSGALARMAPAPTLTADQQMLEGLADTAVREAMSPIPVETLRRVIASAASPEDLAERLGALYQGDDAEAFRELMSRALFAADVLGYVTAEQRIGDPT